MLRPQHAILQAQGASAMSPRRMVSIGIVGLLHVAFIYAIITGLAQRFVKALPPVIEARIIQQPVEPPKTQPLPPPPMVQPTVVQQPTIPPPDIVIQQDAPPPVQVQVAPPAPVVVAPPAPPVTSAVQGINSTHTTPPYPDQERRLGISGNVVLHISISETGAVTGATVTQSSGNAELDQTAVNWVVGHWKYKPAIASGTPVASTTDARVVFDIKKAR